MNFTTVKAIIKDSEEWNRVYKSSFGGDCFPSSPVCPLPALVLEMDNPNRAKEFTSKIYVFISAADIQKLLSLG